MVLRTPAPLIAPPVLQAYKPLRTFVALVGLEIWSNGDQISVTPPAGANLDAFMKWRNTELLQRKKHDNAHLIRSDMKKSDFTTLTTLVRNVATTIFHLS